MRKRLNRFFTAPPYTDIRPVQDAVEALSLGVILLGLMALPGLL